MRDEDDLAAELAALDGARLDLDARLRDAAARSRYCPDEAVRAAARRDEAALLRELDRLMTRIRAVEGQITAAREGRP
ncbi:MAG TPA: hypothetical protein VM434_06580 [Beijerinckiaceae bacterium]|nr:hypothetical protein [Beijerinckiaceae bacterium]